MLFSPVFSVSVLLVPIKCDQNRFCSATVTCVWSSMMTPLIREFIIRSADGISFHNLKGTFDIFISCPVFHKKTPFFDLSFQISVAVVAWMIC